MPSDDDGNPTPDFTRLLWQKERFRQAGIDLVVLETAFPWAQHAKFGGPNAEAEIETCCELIRNMGRVGIPVACWNWMAVFNWVRTSLTIPTRGGALVTGYDHALMADAPLTEEGVVTEETLWKNLKTFMEAVVPVAEEAGVKLALHPDDPPISPIRGVGRILTSPEAIKKAIDLVPSANNGVTFCQGSFATMNADIPAEIEAFAKKARSTSSTSAMSKGTRRNSRKHSTTMAAPICGKRCAPITGLASPARCARITFPPWRPKKTVSRATKFSAAFSHWDTSRVWRKGLRRRRLNPSAES